MSPDVSPDTSPPQVRGIPHEPEQIMRLNASVELAIGESGLGADESEILLLTALNAISPRRTSDDQSRTGPCKCVAPTEDTSGDMARRAD